MQVVRLRILISANSAGLLVTEVLPQKFQQGLSANKAWTCLGTKKHQNWEQKNTQTRRVYPRLDLVNIDEI